MTAQFVTVVDGIGYMVEVIQSGVRAGLVPHHHEGIGACEFCGAAADRAVHFPALFDPPVPAPRLRPGGGRCSICERYSPFLDAHMSNFHSGRTGASAPTAEGERG